MSKVARGPIWETNVGSKGCFHRLTPPERAGVGGFVVLTPEKRGPPSDADGGIK
jgi:hypothetical protein